MRLKEIFPAGPKRRAQSLGSPTWPARMSLGWSPNAVSNRRQRLLSPGYTLPASSAVPCAILYGTASSARCSAQHMHMMCPRVNNHARNETQQMQTSKRAWQAARPPTLRPCTGTEAGVEVGRTGDAVRGCQPRQGCQEVGRQHLQNPAQ